MIGLQFPTGTRHLWSAEKARDVSDESEHDADNSDKYGSEEQDPDDNPANIKFSMLVIASSSDPSTILPTLQYG